MMSKNKRAAVVGKFSTTFISTLIIVLLLVIFFFFSAIVKDFTGYKSEQSIISEEGVGVVGAGDYMDDYSNLLIDRTEIYFEGGSYGTWILNR